MANKVITLSGPESTVTDNGSEALKLLKEIELQMRDPTNHSSLMVAYLNVWLKIHKFLVEIGELDIYSNNKGENNG